MDERVFRRLYALQGIMSNALGHNGAANPRYVGLSRSRVLYARGSGVGDALPDGKDTP